MKGIKLVEIKRYWDTFIWHCYVDDLNGYYEITQDADTEWIDYRDLETDEVIEYLFKPFAPYAHGKNTITEALLHDIWLKTNKKYFIIPPWTD